MYSHESRLEELSKRSLFLSGSTFFIMLFPSVTVEFNGMTLSAMDRSLLIGLFSILTMYTIIAAISKIILGVYTEHMASKRRLIDALSTTTPEKRASIHPMVGSIESRFILYRILFNFDFFTDRLVPLLFGLFVSLMTLDESQQFILYSWNSLFGVLESEPL